jgi:U3 small nucleolar RNA-associated protein 22
LRDTEDLFSTNLLKLEVDELLGEVKVDYAKQKRIESALMELKGVFDRMPTREVTAEKDLLPGLSLREHSSREQNPSFTFTPPDRMDLVGSYLLRTVTKPNLNVDVAVQIPQECFLPRDHLNYRYFDKRSLYLSVLAKELQKHTHLFGRVSFSCFRDDECKPILLLHPDEAEDQTEATQGKKRKLKRKKAGFVVRIIPCISFDTFKLSLLVPIHNNVRRYDATDQADTLRPQPPTPHYNNRLLEDMGFKFCVEELFSVAGCKSFTDTCMLLKVWIRQRGFEQRSDSLNGFIGSMLLLFLLRTRKLSRHMTVAQMFHATMKFIADTDPNKNPLLMPAVKSEGGAASTVADISTVPTPEAIKAMQQAFAVVFIDSTGRLNLAARMSSDAWCELQHEAKTTLILLNHGGHTGGGDAVQRFEALFLRPVDKWMKYDQYIYAPPMPASSLSTTAQDYLLDFTPLQYWTRRLASLCRQALSDRLLFLRAWHEPLGEWELTEQPRYQRISQESRVCIGLLLHPTHSRRAVDKGPSADTPQAKNFRAFWGPKSELRRFQDGTIVEAVLWPAPHGARHMIVSQIVSHIFCRHEPSITAEQVYGAAGHLQALLRTSESAGQDGTGSVDDSAQSMEQATPLLLETHARLEKAIKGLSSDPRPGKNTLPLRIVSFQGISPEYRYTSLSPPLKHPLAMPGNSNLGSSKLASVGGVLSPLVILLTFESSAHWPNEVEALRKCKTAFYLLLASLLSEMKGDHGHATMHTIPRSDGLDVLFEGYAFRIVIYQRKELQLLKQRHRTLEIQQVAEKANKNTEKDEPQVMRAALSTFGTSVLMICCCS